MTIGARLREERERLGFAQPAFAGLAETTRKSQIDYEKDLTQPKAGYLAAIAKVGADVRYIVTGQREGPPAVTLKPDEEVMLNGYRALDPSTQKRVLAFIFGGEVKPASGVTQVVHGEVGNMNTVSQGNLTISAPIHVGGVGGSRKR